MNLVIVESPNKCKKISSYLGPGYRVVATIGHFRDLPARELAVDEETLDPTYVVDPKKEDIVKRLKAEASKATEIYLAPDPDREGEAIGWHVAQVLKLGARAKRIIFHEITKSAVQKAVAVPVPIDINLVNAQQARRVLDRLVGYKVSPLIQRLGPGLSAGRVQTATLHIVAQRERDRLAFVPEPYFVIKVNYANGMLSELSDDKGKPIRPKNEPEAREVLESTESHLHIVKSIERKVTDKKAPPPFTTSTLQQAASARLNFMPDKTMKVAQALFEAGAISYHRSDSVNLSEDAVRMAREWIGKNRPESLPEKSPSYKSKGGAQEAHEAIRPTSLEDVNLTGDEKSLYDLIGARFLACQMKSAKLARTLVVTALVGGDHHYAARGTEILEPHWLVLGRADEEEEKKDGEDDQVLPEVRREEELPVEKVDLLSKETKPPPGFTEAGLVKEMEKLGIGRPSTYASMIAILYRRNYIERHTDAEGRGASRRKAVVPTPIGMQVDELMLAGLECITSHEYTARMEEKLDIIARGDLDWKDFLKKWYFDFKPLLARAAATWAEMIGDVKKRAAAGDETAARAAGIDPDAPVCDLCGKPMRRRKGKSGDFWGCSGFPECRGTKPIAAQAPARKRGEKATEITCSRCGKPMVERKGKNGKFLSCSGYPYCRETSPIELTKKRAKKCPECGRVMAKRKGRSGDFWGCSGYPECKYTEAVVRKEARKSSKK